MPSLFLHRISILHVYLYIAATTAGPVGQDLHHLAHPCHYLIFSLGPLQQRWFSFTCKGLFWVVIFADTGEGVA